MIFLVVRYVLDIGDRLANTINHTFGLIFLSIILLKIFNLVAVCANHCNNNARLINNRDELFNKCTDLENGKNQSNKIKR